MHPAPQRGKLPNVVLASLLTLPCANDLSSHLGQRVGASGRLRQQLINLANAIGLRFPGDAQLLQAMLLAVEHVLSPAIEPLERRVELAFHLRNGGSKRVL